MDKFIWDTYDASSADRLTRAGERLSLSFFSNATIPAQLVRELQLTVSGVAHTMTWLTRWGMIVLPDQPPVPLSFFLSQGTVASNQWGTSYIVRVEYNEVITSPKEAPLVSLFSERSCQHQVENLFVRVGFCCLENSEEDLKNRR